MGADHVPCVPKLPAATRTGTGLVLAAKTEAVPSMVTEPVPANPVGNDMNPPGLTVSTWPANATGSSTTTKREPEEMRASAANVRGMSNTVLAAVVPGKEAAAPRTTSPPVNVGVPATVMVRKVVGARSLVDAALPIGKTRSSPAAGTAPPQFAASDHFAVEPPPVHVAVAAAAGTTPVPTNAPASTSAASP